MIRSGFFARGGVILLTLIISVLLLAGLVSCGTENVGEGEDAICFTDDLGREVRLTERPVRVAALIGSFADVWGLAGGELCAAAEDAWEDFGYSGEAVNIGGAHSPSLELLISSEPELVLASASTASNLEIGEAVTDMGIAVAYFDVDNFGDYLRMLKICTEVTGRPDLYERHGSMIADEIERIKADFALSGVPEEERRILLLRASSRSVKAKGSSGTVLGEMLADIGCINIADGNAGLLEDLSVEAIIREEPYRIFAVTMGSDTEAATAALWSMINENPAWRTLEAVECGRVHMMEKELFNLKPNARWAEAYEGLYEVLTDE